MIEEEYNMEERLTLDEFCATKSETDKRVELIAGFHFWMLRVRKITKETPSGFEARFREYSVKPA